VDENLACAQLVFHHRPVAIAHRALAQNIPDAGHSSCSARRVISGAFFESEKLGVNECAAVVGEGVVRALDLDPAQRVP